MKHTFAQFLIAAPASGSGKTTISIGMMAALVRRGRVVQPFKCGPDYIDTKYHGMACHRSSYNLDLFMATDSHVKAIYSEASREADICVVEGMMGLFDGFQRQQGSAAHVAATLHLPVILVVDASHTGYSVAPLLQGLARYDADVHVKGVIFNKVGSPRHDLMLREAAADAGLVCLGCVPRQRQAEASSRYLGLDFSRTTDMDEMADLVEQHVDIDRLLLLTSGERPQETIDHHTDRPLSDCHIVVARNDDSFSFVYQHHIDLLQRLGRVTFFNPEDNQPIPADTTLLYLPGGYPEQHLEALQRAQQTRASIRRYAISGGKILAECGGMMYLCKDIVSDEGTYEMCGVLPYSIGSRKSDRKLSLGYRRVTVGEKEYRGHEFHYSQFLPPLPHSGADVFNARNEQTPSPFIIEGNVVASYTHLYWQDEVPFFGK